MADEIHAIRLTLAWEPGQRGVWLRRFGFPSGITDAHGIWLVLEGSRPPLSLTLNGHQLALTHEVSRHRRGWEVTGLLARRNELTLVIDAAESEAPSRGRCRLPAEIGEVRLEIVTAQAHNDA